MIKQVAAKKTKGNHEALGICGDAMIINPT